MKKLKRIKLKEPKIIEKGFSKQELSKMEQMALIGGYYSVYGGACGGALCPADACGGAACGGFACPANACGGNACGGNICPANACGIQLCPVDVCSIDACIVDVFNSYY